MNIFEKLKDYKTVILGYSGGVDSQVLLHLLMSIKHLKIVAMHVNHNINEESQKWESFCHSHNTDRIKVLSKSIDLSNTNNLENEARQERYSFFKEEYKKYEKGTVALLTAHHLNDKAETFLLKLMRGAGLDGLSSIKEQSDLFGMTVLRPLLEYSKTEIIEYAEKHNLKWVEDPSNKSLEYDRNYIRNEIMPLLEKRWGHAPKMINKSANLIEESRLFINNITKELYSVNNSGELDTRILKEYDYTTQKFIIRDWLKTQTEMSPDSKLVDAIINQCVKTKPHNAGKVIKKFFTITKNNHILKICPNK